MRQTVAIVVLLVISLSLGPAPIVEGTPRHFEVLPNHLVSDISAEDAVAMGARVVDDYRSFLSVYADTIQVARIKAIGGVVLPISHDIGRGAYDVGADIPQSLMAPANSPLQLVQFRGPIKASWQQQLLQHAEIVEYIPHFGYLVQSRSPEILFEIEGVHRVEPYHPAFKLSPLIQNSGSLELIAYAISGDESALVDKLKSAGVDVLSSFRTELQTVFFLRVGNESLPVVAALPQITWLEPALRRGEFDMGAAAGYVQSGSPINMSINDKGIDGNSQKIIVCDSGVGSTFNTSYSPQIVLTLPHEMLSDSSPYNADVGKLEANAHLSPTPLTFPPHRKVELYYSPLKDDGTPVGDFQASTTSHGTRTTHIAAGDRMTNGIRDELDGVAYAARVFICDIAGNGEVEILQDHWRYFEPGYIRGARVASNSWGSSVPFTNETGSLYTHASRQQDEIAWAYRDLVIVRAAGNGQTFLRPEAVAKSVITVGATEHRIDELEQSDGQPEDVWIFSNRGPTADGRLKPNVVAPGASVYAARGLGYGNDSGTSFATPAVAGAAALIRDYFNDGFYPNGVANPSDARQNVTSALVRGLIQVSTYEVSGDGSPTYPNFVQGWGRVLLDRGLHFSDEPQKLLVLDEHETANLSTGGYWSRTFQLEAGAPLRVMLAWTDYPGTLGEATALVNNLNLRLGGPTNVPGVNVVYIGNAFIGNETPPGKAHLPDNLNVEEAVFLNNPMPGQYTIGVTAAEVPRPEGQRFAIVVTGNVQWS